jgi:hypothetical protein
MPAFSPIEALSKMTEASRQRVADADEKFLKSDTLKTLLAKSEQNKSKNKRELQNKYCYRQAEWGVGDCGGLNDIPGLTQNGRQQAPDWLSKMMGKENATKPATSLETLVGPKPDF